MPSVLLLLSLVCVETTVGVPVDVDYGLPRGWESTLLESTDQWEVVSQDSGVIRLIPLDLDTLVLPPLEVWNTDGDSAVLPPPLLVVTRTMPDTLYAVSVFPYPAPLDIPPGFPSDHLEMLMFWLTWGGPPVFDWLLACVIAGAVLCAAALAFFILRKRKRREEPSAPEPTPQPGKPSAEALALLESSWFTEGRWQELYTDVDRLLRNSIEWRFGLGNRALTYGQVRRRLRKEPDGQDFMDAADPLVEEIVIQRYADWGSSRERAQRFVRLLVKIMETWL